MDIEANLWTTCLVLIETTSTAPGNSRSDIIRDRTDGDEMEKPTVKRKKKAKRGTSLKDKDKTSK